MRISLCMRIYGRTNPDLVYADLLMYADLWEKALDEKAKEEYVADCKATYELEKEFLITVRRSPQKKYHSQMPNANDYLVIDFINEKVLENMDQNLGCLIATAMDTVVPGIFLEIASTVKPFQTGPMQSMLEEFVEGWNYGLKLPHLEDHIIQSKSKGKGKNFRAY